MLKVFLCCKFGARFNNALVYKNQENQNPMTYLVADTANIFSQTETKYIYYLIQIIFKRFKKHLISVSNKLY